ncbi:MAG TPA: permease prefix domain 2-containing transporter [Bryobacteraceae bacterium]|nr:permease prefix domain 2-containing transporter [Bryobacteraceae bacterium]
MKPPAFAQAVLTAVTGPSWADCVAGDLAEEFALIYQARGRRAAVRWYLWQAVRSAAPLMVLGIRSGELRDCTLVALASVFIPVVLMDRLWCFVYSQIPMKDGTARAPELLAANVVIACLGAAIFGLAERSGMSPQVKALSATAAAGLAVCGSVGGAPALYVSSLLVCVAASCLFGAARRRLA